MYKDNKDVFQILSDAISEGIVIVDEKQNIVSTNVSADTIFGYNKNELEGTSLNALIPKNYHTDHVIHYKSFFKNSEKRKMSPDTNLFGLHKNGTQFPVEVGLSPFTIFNKTYVMALIIDVTERKEIERNLILRSEALQTANNGILISDALAADNPIIYSNLAFLEMTGYSLEEVLGKNCRFLQCDDRDQEGILKMRDAFKNGHTCKVILRNYKKNGTLFWNDLTITPIKNSKGIVTNYIGIQNDITKRKEAEDERNYLSKILNDSLNEIYVFDLNTLKFITINYGARKNLGYSLEELKTMSPFSIKPKFTEKKFKQLTTSLVDKTITKIEFETLHARKDKSTYPVLVNMELANLGDREVIVAIVLDITEQKNYTQKLERTVALRTKQLEIALGKEKELNELKTKFLSLVSHEFKTPLSGILTSCILLSKYDLEEQQEKRDKYIQIITDKVHYLNNILNDFLSIEKLETGKIKYKFTTFKLGKLLNDVVYNANMFLKKGQQIIFSDNCNDISITQDEKTLELSLSNLVNNAIKYSSENTVIGIQITHDDLNTTFKISDSGIGIPEKDQKNIFHRYFRAENALNTEGTGIGLNIVQFHIENLGGSITFESAENKGSTFILTIPNKAL